LEVAVDSDKFRRFLRDHPTIGFNVMDPTEYSIFFTGARTYRTILTLPLESPKTQGFICWMGSYKLVLSAFSELSLAVDWREELPQRLSWLLRFIPKSFLVKICSTPL